LDTPLDDIAKSRVIFDFGQLAIYDHQLVF